MSAIFEAALGATTGLANLGLGLYDRQKQDKLNKLQMQREDSAYQRAVKDANLAGLSKASISGSASSSPLTAPKSPDVDIIGQAQQAMANKLSLQQQEADITKTMAESKNIEFQNMKFDADSKYFVQNALNEAQALSADTGLKQWFNTKSMKSALLDLRLAQVGSLNSSSELKKVRSALARVNLAFDEFREHTILGTRQGKFGKGTGDLESDMYARREDYRKLIVTSEVQAKLNTALNQMLHNDAMGSQAKLDKSYFDFYNQSRDNQHMFRNLRDTKNAWSHDIQYGFYNLFGGR